MEATARGKVLRRWHRSWNRRQPLPSAAAGRLRTGCQEPDRVGMQWIGKQLVCRGLLNNLAGHLGLLRDWTPWVVAAAPSALYLFLSLAAFSWLVRYR